MSNLDTSVELMKVVDGEDVLNRTASTESTAAPTKEKEEQDRLHKLKHGKPLARAVFHAVNFLGLHIAFNSTVSVLIAYNILPKPGVQKLVDKLATSSVGRAADMVFSAPGKVIDLVVSLGSKVPKKILTKAEKDLAAHHNARSSIETMFMCIAGFFALFPVKWLEDSRAGFLNKVDNFFHPGRSKEEKEALALKPEDEPKETWGNLLRARFIGLGVVFSVDRLQQHLNNWMTYEKGNVDTWAWKFGAKGYENMNPKARNWLVNFFARKNVTIGGIQPSMREHLFHTIDAPHAMQEAGQKMGELQESLRKNLGNKQVESELSKGISAINEELIKSSPKMKQNVERAVFAEQARLFLTKELWLTTIISVVIYTAAKSKKVRGWMEKIGLAKPEKPHGEAQATPEPATVEPAPAVVAPVVEAPASAPAAEDKKWADKTAPVQEKHVHTDYVKKAEMPEPKVIEPFKKPEESFGKKILDTAKESVEQAAYL